jgi:UDP-GlcNAc:undecaprenyl-phosphate GlcNAc-1-phosphate transferase
MSQLLSLLESFNRPEIMIAGLIAATAFLSSLVLTRVMRHYAPRLGLVDRPGTRKIHARVMPKGGGLAILISLILASALGWFLLSVCNGMPSTTALAVTPEAFGKKLLLLLGCGVVISLLGLIDDLKNLSPYRKIFVESLVACILIYHGQRVTLFIPNFWFSVLVTWGWLLLITNSFNLLDNMDGLSAGVAFISGAIFLVVAVQTRQWQSAFLLLALLGSLLGFLCFNFPPATIFMGDSGSLLLGYLMGILTIDATFYHAPGTVLPVALPLVVMAVPLFDTSTVAWLRWRSKCPIFQGDKRHFSHRLVDLGMTNRQAVLTIYLVTFATGLGATVLYDVSFWGGLLILVQTVVILAVIHILQQVGARRPTGNNHSVQSPAQPGQGA